MRKIDGAYRFSASDLMRFKGCPHATALDLRRLEVGDLASDADDEEAALLQAQGDAHERAFLERLRAEGRRIVEIDKDRVSLEKAVVATEAALRSGTDVIYQGAFLEGAWGGYSDFLERVEAPSALGDFSYEVVDTKLKRKPDPKHVLQLSLYSDLLESLQGRAPAVAHLELGDGRRETVDLGRVSAYARHARSAFQAFVADPPATRPEPVAACGLCPWRSHCEAWWQAEDSLALVAGMARSQRGKVEAAGVRRMSELAEFSGHIPQLDPDVRERLQIQARLQSARRAGGPPTFALRAAEPGRGLHLLPKPDEGDIFYDIEGDPYFPGGLEYLHGIWLHEDGVWRFRDFWAHDRAAEGRATAGLLEFLVERLSRRPDAHVYHYANYEMAALRRLTALHRVGEAALDQLQRERRFVDLYRVVSGGLIASEPGYSIKDLEAFYMEKRQGEVATAGASVVMYERWRAAEDPNLLAEIRAYNETDCRSTQELRDWLVRVVRPADQPWPTFGEIPAAGALSNVAGEEAEAAALRARLVPLVPDWGQAPVDLLADLHDFHAREDKPAWWAIFDRLSGDGETLADDLECLAGLEAIAPPVQVTSKSFERTYRFPPQETKLRAGKRPCVRPAAKPDDVELRALDREARTVVLRRSHAKGALPDRLDLIPPMPFRKTVLRTAIEAVGVGLLAGDRNLQAVEHLLLRRAPEFLSGPRARIVDTSAKLADEVSAAVLAMADTVLPIQGPPGAGKTYVSACAIVELVRQRRRVAVSSNSHKAIANLLCAVAEQARLRRVPCSIVQKAGEDEEEVAAQAGIVMVEDNHAPEIAVADVVGATAWHFARYDDYPFSHLFVDEAGQVSLANLVAMGRAARNVVLAGDPMQLPQPLQGVHPGQSGLSCLEYLLGDARVVAPDRGVFMPRSRRMHPRVCDFISAAIYEGRLSSDPVTLAQDLRGPEGRNLTGARLQPVDHAGRSQVCPEEVEAVDDLVRRLQRADFTPADGPARRIRLTDILVVAPYNAQVNALRQALPPEVRVGTVDRFQGQEAAVCIVSMTTSSGEEMPRDLGFLFSLNRINVAVSRAQVAAFVLASPRLLEAPCRTLDEMALVNTLCLLKHYGDALDDTPPDVDVGEGGSPRQVLTPSSAIL